ncbi:MAG: VWA domain-containing protein [Deltaproteobacteria bacterium]|nr:VWA domain-containing protein [Deltaproteobacteria bacterium]
MRRGLLGLLLALGAALAIVALALELPAEGLSFSLGSEALQLARPHALVALGLVPLVVYAATLSLAGLSRLQLSLATGLRALGLALLALALSAPSRERDETKVALGVLVDVSDSITDAALDDARERVRELDAGRGEATLFVVSYARHARRLRADSGDLAAAIVRPREAQERDATDLGQALGLAEALFPPGRLRRLLILSDGVQTRGDELAAARAAARRGVEISYAIDRHGRPPEHAILGVDLPEEIDVGQPFNLRVEVFSTEAGSAHLSLSQDGRPNGLDPGREITLTPGRQELTLRSVVHRAGPVTYVATLRGDAPDGFAENDRFETTPTIPGRPSVLYVEGDRAHATHFVRALEAAELEVDVRGPSGIPRSAAELGRFDFFVLSNVAAEAVSATQQVAIERFVRDQGGGFLMAGGDRGFGLGGWQGTRLARLSPVLMDSQRRRDEPSLALALVIDKSGSMNGQKLELAKQAAKATARMLSASDYLGVIGFDSQPEHVVRMQSAGNRVGILRDIGRLAPRGGTAIFPALDMAYQDLSSIRARFKHVILLTDGQSPERGISELVQVMRAEGMTLSTVGLGADVNRALLSQIASEGGGRSYFTADPHNIPRIFMRETTTVSRGAAVEDYFVPHRVEPADFLRGVDLAHAPYLRGYVATQPRGRPSQVILASDLGEPILARWRVGLGWSLAWTSDLTNRWAADWLRWPGASRFFAQLVREHMRQRHSRSVPMEAQIEDDEVRVRIDAIDAADALVDDLEAEVVLEGPLVRGDDAPQVSAPLEAIAPGRYEARLPLTGYGSFRVRAELSRDGRPYGQSRARVDRPYPREYALSEGGEDALVRVASEASGRADPSLAWLLDPRGHSLRGAHALWPPLLALALLLFLLDLLSRRLRLGRIEGRRMLP